MNLFKWCGPILLCAPAFAHAELYQVDGLVEGGEAAYQGGFAPGEVAVVCFEEPGGFYPVRLTAFRFAFGGADPGNQHLVKLHVFDAIAPGEAPGASLLETEAVEVLSAVEGLNEIDISEAMIQVDGPWCLGVELTEAGLPSVARDSDGDIDADVNWIRQANGAWLNSAAVGLAGDWVIRSVGSPTGAPVEADAGVVVDLGVVVADIGVIEPVDAAIVSPDAARVVADASVAPEADSAVPSPADTGPGGQADSGQETSGGSDDDCSATPGDSEQSAPWALALLLLGVLRRPRS